MRAGITYSRSPGAAGRAAELGVHSMHTERMNRPAFVRYIFQIELYLDMVGKVVNLLLYNWQASAQYMPIFYGTDVLALYAYAGRTQSWQFMKKSQWKTHPFHQGMSKHLFLQSHNFIGHWEVAKASNVLDIAIARRWLEPWWGETAHFKSQVLTQARGKSSYIRLVISAMRAIMMRETFCS